MLASYTLVNARYVNPLELGGTTVNAASKITAPSNAAHSFLPLLKEGLNPQHSCFVAEEAFLARPFIRICVISIPAPPSVSSGSYWKTTLASSSIGYHPLFPESNRRRTV